MKKDWSWRWLLCGSCCEFLHAYGVQRKPTSRLRKPNSAASAAKRDAAEVAKEQDRQKILSMKDSTLADLYKQKPKAKDEIEKHRAMQSLMHRVYMSRWCQAEGS